MKITNPIIMGGLLLLSPLFIKAQDAASLANTYTNYAQMFSNIAPQGTARYQAIGGSHAALGADLSNISYNPAGVGFYNRSEVSITASLNSLSTNASYINQTYPDQYTKLTIPNFGIVFANDNQNGDWHGAFAIGYSRQATLKTTFILQGMNEKSSLLDNAANSATNRNISPTDLNNEFDNTTGNPTSYEGLFYQGYLIDPGANNTYQNRLDATTVTKQRVSFTSDGKITQWTFAYGGSYKNKLYLGGSIGFVGLSYRYSSALNEKFSDKNANVTPVVNNLAYTEDYSASGSGLNLSFGMIYRPLDIVRVGFSVTTPTWYSNISETKDASLYAAFNPNMQNDNNGKPISSIQYNLNQQIFDYQLTTPLRMATGVAFFLGKKGFVSADVEYVNYKGMSVGSSDSPASVNADFKSIVNPEFKNRFDNAFNFKVGAEYKISGIFNVRAGVASKANPYKASFNKQDLGRTILQISGGFGVRTSDYYIDFALVNSSYNTGYTPYELSNPNNYYSAKISNTFTSGVLSFGLFF